MLRSESEGKQSESCQRGQYKQGQVARKQSRKRGWKSKEKRHEQSCRKKERKKRQQTRERVRKYRQRKLAASVKEQATEAAMNFFIQWLVTFDPKFSACFCMFWSLEVSLEILSGAYECIHYRLLDGLSGFSFFIGHVFSSFFSIEANQFK